MRCRRNWRSGNETRNWKLIFSPCTVILIFSEQSERFEPGFFMDLNQTSTPNMVWGISWSITNNTQGTCINAAVDRVVCQSEEALFSSLPVSIVYNVKFYIYSGLSLSLSVKDVWPVSSFLKLWHQDSLYVLLTSLLSRFPILFVDQTSARYVRTYVYTDAYRTITHPVIKLW